MQTHTNFGDRAVGTKTATIEAATFYSFVEHYFICEIQAFIVVNSLQALIVSYKNKLIEISVNYLHVLDKFTFGS